MAVTKYMRTARFTLALLGGGGACTWALASGCGRDGTNAIIGGDDDAGRDTGAIRRDSGVLDAGVDTAMDLDSGFSCKAHAGWQTAHPLRAECTVQIAPPERLVDAYLPMRPCANGQAGCTQMALPQIVGRVASNVRPTPIGVESDGFFLRYEGDPDDELCTRAIKIIPSATDYALGGAVEGSYHEPCSADPECGNGDLILNLSGHQNTKVAQRVALATWSPYSVIAEADVTTWFANAYRSGDTLFAFDSLMAQVDIVDIASKKWLRSTKVPLILNQWFAKFAAFDNLWGVANYGELGKGELWRVDVSGTFHKVLQKQGVQVFTPQTDGAILYWIEGSGNDLAIYNQPKMELWASTFSLDTIQIAQHAHVVADVSGVRGGNYAVAHAGYYAAVLGANELIVARGRDGATQRIVMSGTWAGLDLAYVDEHQVWFSHGATNPAEAGVARIMLNPWP